MATPAARMTMLHTAAVAGAVLCGLGALVTFVIGSPLEFGIALALCGACWIAADFIEWTDRDGPVAARVAAPASPLHDGRATSHVVFAAAPQLSWRSESRPDVSLAA